MIRGCRLEDDVRVAVSTDAWTAALRTHAASCASCADVALVTAVLQDRRPSPIVTRDASVIWICARHARRLVLEARLSFAMMTVSTIAATIALAVLLSFVNWGALWSAVTVTELGAATGVTATIGMLIVAALIRARRLPHDQSRIHM